CSSASSARHTGGPDRPLRLPQKPLKSLNEFAYRPRPISGAPDIAGEAPGTWKLHVAPSKRHCALTMAALIRDDLAHCALLCVVTFACYSKRHRPGAVVVRARQQRSRLDRAVA